MNFPGPINANVSSVSAVSLDSEHFSFAPNTHVDTGSGGAGAFVVPDKHLLFTGEYQRAGNDLVLSAQDQKYVIHDYFKGENRAALVSEDGATISAHIIASLTGNVQYAQAAAPDAPQVVGKVLKLAGSASVIRNGVTIELNIGDAVQKGDVIQTGSDSSIAMTLLDGSAFGMTSNARMVLNEMVYDPNGSSNSSFISLVQGTVTFVAGQTAKNGNMRVETPVATMGIRGTAVLVKINAVIGDVIVSLGVEPDGHVGGLVFYDNTTGALVGQMTQAGRVTVFSPGGIGQPVTATEQQKTPADVQADKSLFSQVFQLYFPNFTDDSKPKSTDQHGSTVGVPATVAGKNGTDSDTGRATVTYTIPIINPDTHKTTDLQIVYINTAPQFFVTNAVDVQSTILGQNQFRLGDHVTIVDPDINTAPFFDVGVPYVHNSGAYTATTTSTASNAYLLNAALVSFDPVDGIVTYNPEAFRFLGDGEKAVYKFTFVSASGVGASASDTGNEVLTLTINGENDVPVFDAAIVAVGVSEIGEHSTPSAQSAATGSATHDTTPIVITFQDADFSEIGSNYTVAVTNVTASGATAGLPSDPMTLETELRSFFSFATTPVTKLVNTTAGRIDGTFSATDSTFDYLAAGQTLYITYTIEVTDPHHAGALIPQTLTVTITGSNDQPMISVGATDTTAVTIGETASETGQSTLDSATGTLSFTDPDLTDTHQANASLHAGGAVWSATNGATGIPSATINAINLAMTAAISTGVVGSDSTNTGAGTLAWSFSLADHFLDFLRVNETLTLTYDVFVTDNKGTASSTSSPQQVVVTLTATNDAPVITAGAVTTLAEASDQTGENAPAIADSGVLAFTDTDLDDTHTVLTQSLNSAVWTKADHSTGTVPSLTQSQVAMATTFTVGITDSTGSGSGSLDWHFSLPDHFADFLAVGDTLTLKYDVAIQDNSGDTGTNKSLVKQVVVTITGANDAPTLTVDVSGMGGTSLHAITEQDGITGDVPVLNGPAILPDTATGTLAFTDVDLTDTHTVSQSAPSYAWSGGMLTTMQQNALTAAAMLTLTPHDSTGTGAGSIDFAYSADDASFDFLADGQTLTVTYDVTVADYSSGNANGTSSTQPVTITITGTNDAPVINQSSQTASVSALGTIQVGGQFTETDPDAGDAHTWTVDGGARIGAPDYHFAIDDFKVVKVIGGTPTIIFEDTFTGTAPPAPPTVNPNGQQYATTSADGFVNNQFGEALIDGTNAAFVGLRLAAANYGEPVVGQFASLLTDVSPGGTNGLRPTSTFAVQGLFDLATPTLTGEAYGLRLSDRQNGGTPTDQPGDDTIELAVVQDSSGNTAVQFSALNMVAGTFTILQSISVGTIAPGEQVLLQLAHSATNPGEITASYSLVHGGITDPAVDFSATTSIFHGEDWTRAQFFGRAPAVVDSTSPDADSILKGMYGSLDIDQTGKWTYVLDPGLAATHALAGGQMVHDTFQVRVTDGSGASDFKTVDVTVTGANDAPDFSGSSIGGAGSGFTENGPAVAIVSSGGLVVHDIDNANFNGGSLTATLTAGSHTGDTLSIGTTSHIMVDIDGVTVLFDADGSAMGATFVPIGTLTASGGGLTVALNSTADAAAVMELTQAIRFASTSDDPTSDIRTVQLTLIDGSGTANGGHDTTSFDVTVAVAAVNDAPMAGADPIANATPPLTAAGWVLNTDNGHYYRYVDGAGYATWTGAKVAAATDGGYLATVTSSQESSFVYNLIANHTGGGTWLGGYGPVAADASSWYWVSGPEQGVHFTYTNWDAVYGEPNGDGPTGYVDAGLNINPDGSWNDVPTSYNDHMGGFGYVEEWGGQAGQTIFREDTGTTLTTQQLLANDTDVDNTASQLSITAVSGASAHGGTVSLDGNIISYHPTANYSGTDSFTYTLFDGSLTSTGTVSFDVAPVADAPTLAIGPSTPVANGNEFVVNTTTAGDQSQSFATALSSGGYLITWNSAGQDGSGQGVYGRIYDASGNATSGEFRVNTSTPGDQANGFGAGFSDGGFVVTWTDGNNNASITKAQRFDASGTKVGGELTVGNGENSSVTVLTNGDFVVSFSGADNDSAGRFAQIYHANGTPSGSLLLLNTTTTGYQANGIVEATPDGGFVATWWGYGQDGSPTPSFGTFLQRFDANGATLGGEVQVNTANIGNQIGGGVAVLTDGTFVVSFTDNNIHAVETQRFNADGSSNGSEVVIGTGTDIVVKSLPDGGYVAVYSATDAGGDPGIFGQRVSASGALIGSAFAINQTTAGDQSFLSDRSLPLTVLNSGQIVTTWGGPSTAEGNLAVFARIHSVPGIGAEDTAITLPTFTAALGPDSSEVLSLHLTGFPAGSTFSAGSLVGSEWVIPASAIAALATTPLTVTAAHGFTGNFTLHVDAVSTDIAVLSTGTVSDTAHSTAYDIAVLVTVNNGPELIGDAISAQEIGPTTPDYGYGSITTVFDLALSDSDEGSALSTVSAVAGHGTVTYGMGNTSLATGVSATVTDINAIFQNGVTYTPTSAPSAGNNDKVSVTVTDSHGASDTINFIFQQADAPNATQLTGTAGKDLIFATEHNDMLFGDAGRDNFVFASTTGQHIVTDFTQGQDRIDLHMSGAPNNTTLTLSDWLSSNAAQMGADTILYLDPAPGHTAQNEIVLQHVTLANLTANDFIIHSA